MVKGVRIRIYHHDCGQYTQLRRRPPRNNVRCPACGRLATTWLFEAEVQVNEKFVGAWWPTTPQEKMGSRLRLVPCMKGEEF